MGRKCLTDTIEWARFNWSDSVGEFKMVNGETMIKVMSSEEFSHFLFSENADTFFKENILPGAVIQ